MSKFKIMIVDDDPNLSRLMRIILDRAGAYQICEENRSSIALSTAREFKPDLILMDVDMPGKNGAEVAGEFESDAWLCRTPIVFVTSLVSKSEAGTRNGKRYMSKPIDPKLLLETVRESLLPVAA